MEIIQVEKTITVSKYKASDGTVFDTEYQCLDYEKRKNGERIECPRCGGRGGFNYRTEIVRNELTCQYEEVGFHDTCTKCGGKGYLDKKVSWE